MSLSLRPSNIHEDMWSSNNIWGSRTFLKNLWTRDSDLGWPLLNNKYKPSNEKQTQADWMSEKLIKCLFILIIQDLSLIMKRIVNIKMNTLLWWYPFFSLLLIIQLRGDNYSLLCKRSSASNLSTPLSTATCCKVSIDKVSTAVDNIPAKNFDKKFYPQ